MTPILTIPPTLKENVGIYAKNLKTGEEIKICPDKVFGIASIIKIGIAVALLDLVQKGRLSLDQKIKIEKKKLYSNPGRDSGILSGYPDGSLVTIDVLMNLMISVSDNAATNALLSLLPARKVNGFLKNNGFLNTKLNVNQLDMFLFSESQKDLGDSTPAEMGKLLESLVENKILNKKYSEKLISLMSLETVSTKIGRFLPTPKNVTDEKAEIVLFASKGGVFPRLKNNVDVAIIKTKKGEEIIICIFTNGIDDKDPSLRNASPEHASTKLIANLGKDIFEKLK